MRRRFSASLNGFTLAELLLAAAILAFVLTAILMLFISCIILNEISRCNTLAYNAIQAKMEEIKDTASANLDSFNSLDLLNGTSFELTGFSSGNGKGRIEVTNEGSINFKRITIRACFMSRRRLIGDDIDNCQSSPVELTTLIVRQR